MSSRDLFVHLLVAGALAGAAAVGLHATAFAAECLENPDYRVTEPGHWYYHFDRSLNRKCWYFESAEKAVTTPAPAAPPPAQAEEASQPSLLSRFAASLSQPMFTPQQQPQPQLQQEQVQPSTIPDNTGEAAQTVSPKPAKPVRAVRRERERPQPQPTTTGAASAEHDHNQTATAEKNENYEKEKYEKNDKRDTPMNVTDREALFQDFMKWQLERNVFGSP